MYIGVKKRRKHEGRFIKNAQGGKLRSGWCNPNETNASYRWLEEAARVFVIFLVYAVLNWRVLEIASAGASGTVTVEDQKSYTKIEILGDNLCGGGPRI